ncbi:UDP-glucose 6-dehydrogenase [Daldinia caldariorum]|uniref:UDP-glucose 6-dehydrogenase n=1 Tax=Daldinia caldariorum TaxID=326644 RepID=UPI002008B9AA|nr:UDP-glucose 6-dehydrogenase [Daldinia caldariorum]KAI1463791.1 UDP-glucose 6-dehydrogenase [Daldinia caldariorum]
MGSIFAPKLTAATRAKGGSVVSDDSTAPTSPSSSSSLTFTPGLAADYERTNPSRTITHRVRRICCVGAGYVGGPTAAVIAYHNPEIDVTVVDKDKQRIQRWNSKHLPIYEPGLVDIVRIARDGARGAVFLNKPTDTSVDSLDLSAAISSKQGFVFLRENMIVDGRAPNLFFSDRVAQCIGKADIVLIAVNTPTKSKGAGAGSATDMTAFEDVAVEVAKHAMPGTIIVEKSTVPCGTAELVRNTMAIHRPGVHFEILSNPEFLAAGTAMKDLMHPDRILIGSINTASGRKAAKTLASVYEAWVPPSRIIMTNVYSSELSKLVANSMLAQRISSINSISAICEKTGADVDEIAASIGSDPRIGDKFLKAGIGFGGSCFKKDILSLVYLAESLGLDEVGEYWRQVVKMNEYQRDRFSRRVIRCLNNTLLGKKITLLGYAFKANNSDTRESPALEIIKTLLEERPKEIAVFDPCCNPVVVKTEIKGLLSGQPALKEDGGPIEIHWSAYTACERSNAILITTECDEFRSSRTYAGGLGLPLTSPKAVDPRPLPNPPTESDLMSLQNYSLSIAPANTYPDNDPLKRYRPQPACESSCLDCRLIKASGYSTAGNSGENRPKERLDWSRISLGMNKPKWLFDGKGIIDAAELGELGFRVESIGRH